MDNVALYNQALKSKNCSREQACRILDLNRLTLSLKLKGKRKIYLLEAKRISQLTGLTADCDSDGYLILSQ